MYLSKNACQKAKQFQSVCTTIQGEYLSPVGCKAYYIYIIPISFTQMYI